MSSQPTCIQAQAAPIIPAIMRSASHEVARSCYSSNLAHPHLGLNSQKPLVRSSQRGRAKGCRGCRAPMQTVSHRTTKDPRRRGKEIGNRGCGLRCRGERLSSRWAGGGRGVRPRQCRILPGSCIESPGWCYHAGKETAERKIAELESTITQPESDLEQARGRPSTPQQSVNANGAATSMRPPTPTALSKPKPPAAPIAPPSPLVIFSPSSSSRLKSQPSVTQMYSDHKKLEKELADEKRNNEEKEEKRRRGAEGEGDSSRLKSQASVA